MILALDSYLLTYYICGLLLTLWSHDFTLTVFVYSIGNAIFWAFFASGLMGTDLFHVQFTTLASLWLGALVGMVMQWVLGTPELLSRFGYPHSIWIASKKRFDPETQEIPVEINDRYAIYFNGKSAVIVIALLSTQIIYNIFAHSWIVLGGLITLASLFILYPVAYCAYLADAGPVFGNRSRLAVFLIYTGAIHISTVVFYFWMDALTNNIAGSFITLCVIAAVQVAVLISMSLAFAATVVRKK